MKQLIEKAFAANGLLVGQGGRHTPEQGQYAESVAQVLLSKGGLGLLEAETGVGKSLGYLIPGLIWLAQNPKKQIVISTFTRALQKQLIFEDVAKATQVIAALGLPVVKVAFRMGKESFFSVERVARVIASIQTDENKDLLHKFYQFAVESASHGSGLCSDWIEEFGQLPCDISPRSIGLIGAQTSIAYENHLAAAREARLLITNHATMMIAVNRGILNPDNVHAVIVDEAHEFENAAKSFLNYRLNFQEIENTSKGFEGHSDVVALLSHWQEQLTVYSDSTLISSRQSKIMLQQQVYAEKLSGLLGDMHSKLKPALKESDAGVELSELARQVRHWCAMDETTTRKAIAFSDKKKIPSLAMVSAVVSPFTRYLFEQLDANLVLTSATIADMQQSTAFSGIKGALGLRDFAVLCESRFSPAKYGQMTFSIMPHKGKAFVGVDDDMVYDQAWLNATAQTIKNLQGKTLVLVPSFREAKVLARLIDDQARVICHTANQPNYQVIDRFINQQQILITPSCWEGVNVRNADGSQVIENIVITRIPFAPPDMVKLKSLTAYLDDAVEAQKIIYLSGRNAAFRKLKQGMGRGIRSPNDTVHVVFCDSRITGARQAIPKRFQSDFDAVVNRGKVTNVF